MRNKEEVAKHIQKVFKEYAESFDRSLNTLGIHPWTDKKIVIHEFNLVHRFLDAYQKTGENIDTWMELPVYYEGGKKGEPLAHIDAFIVDQDRKLIFFIEAKRLSKNSQLASLKKDIERVFSISHNIYVGDGSFKGINLFECDAYMIPLADIWEYRSDWCKDLAKHWAEKARDIESIYTYTLTTMVRSIDIPDEGKEETYHLVGALYPVFDSEKYKKEVEIERHERSRAADKSILVWADEVGFESLLAAVNKRKKKTGERGKQSPAGFQNHGDN